MAGSCRTSRRRPAPASRWNWKRCEGAVLKGQTQEIRLLLVDDHAMFREGLARSLEKEHDLKVVGECSSAAEAIALLKTGPTMVLLDVDLGAGRALEFVETANQMGFEGQILVVTAGVSGQEAVQ